MNKFVLKKVIRIQLVVICSSIFILLLLYGFIIRFNKLDSFVESISESSSIIKSSKFLSVSNSTQFKNSVPIRLKIPKISVDAKVIEMGITPEGNMDAPKNLDEVGWYKYGTKPGEIGSAVIDGHLGVGVRGVFVDLHKLHVGDYIETIDIDENIRTFVVKDIRLYDRLDRPEEVFISNDGASHLNLITCSGDWIDSIPGTPNRLVVFTDLVK